MHYKNGRLALPGDKVINLTSGHSGVLHSINEQSTSCNGHVVAITEGNHYTTISDCLHQDDIAAADIPDSSAPPAPVAEPMDATPAAAPATN